MSTPVTVRGRPLPPFIAEVVEDREKVMGLVAACLALGAAGLDPHVLDPGSPRMQAALAADPSVQYTLIIAALMQAALVLVGGAVADIWRSRRLLIGALLALVVASVGVTIFPQGPGLVAFRVVAWVADGLIIPFAIGTVAMLYRGGARATALGVLFAVYGAATAAAPFLVTVFGSGGPEIQAFALCSAVAVLAAWVVARHLPDLPGALPGQRPQILATVLWAVGVICLANGLLVAETWLVVAGIVPIVLGLAVRRLRGGGEEGVHVRRTGAALMAGLVVGFAQGVPMLAIPAFFTAVQGMDGMVATILIAPFVVALLVAGPASGYLMTRFPARQVIIGGVWAVGLANVLFALLLSQDTPYLPFVLPFLLVGGGFVIATAIRTAVIFANTPRHLPATAAALNEASIGVGARVGTTLVILLRTTRIVEATELEALRIGVIAAAIVAVVGGVLVFLLMGRGDPVTSVWELREERAQGS